MLRRIYHDLLNEHFQREGNMAFLAGPRQTGKTTTATELRPKQTSYWSWDDDLDRALLRSPASKFLQAVQEKNPDKTWLVLDEIHKNPKWRGWLKGFYDKNKKAYKVIVTGSARLNIFNRGGDSLLGRYYLYRHHPFSLGEVEGLALRGLFREPPRQKPQTLQTLLKFGGFPAPFLSAREESHRKWLRTRRDLLLREDVRDLSRVEDLAALELLTKLLLLRAGGLINHKNLADDLHVSVDTIRRWIKLLENLYYLYTVPPYSKNIKRALIKMPKVYLWDWSEVSDEGARYENMIASHLLKSVHYWTDKGLGDFALHFIRDKEKREVDFLVTKDDAPFLMAEVKSSKENFSAPLLHFRSLLKPKYCFQVVKSSDFAGTRLVESDVCERISATDFCAALI